MQGMFRNKQEMWYAMFERLERVYDDKGRITTTTRPVYGNPVRVFANISTTTGITNNNIAGRTENAMFGINKVYNAVVNPLPIDFPMDEQSICWIDTKPVINTDGSTDTPADHYVHRVAYSLNSKAYLLTRINSEV